VFGASMSVTAQRRALRAAQHDRPTRLGDHLRCFLRIT
jgi:hypothetical protein